MPRSRLTRPLLAGCIVASTLLLSACAYNPATGGASVVMSSESGEASIGEEMYNGIVENGGVYDDPELQAYVTKIGERLLAESTMADRDFTFTVVDSPDINAFATPGGYIYINRGLLAFLDNEAELAGVLGHEIGHVTARHSGRQRAAGLASAVTAFSLLILTGSSDLAEASQIYGAELISGYGRDMELEADGLGAEYMHLAGYDTENLLEVIGVLKDQQNYQRRKARAAGKVRATYHGLYATHPRNDKRLQEVIAKAGELDISTYIEDPSVPGEFKKRVDGLVWGDTVQSERSDDRYYHNTLYFTILEPEGWSVRSGSNAVVASADDGSAQLTIKLRRPVSGDTPRSVLEGNATGTLTDAKELEQAGLKGYTAVAASGGTAKRLAVIDFNGLGYLFEGEAGDFATKDPELLAIIESFRPTHARERKPGDGKRVRWMQVPRGETMASLAATMKIPDAENQLRLLNGFYPRGEPRTGDGSKIIR